MGANEHVLDERAEGADRAAVLVGAKPHADADVGALSLLIILFHHLEFAGDVGEILGNLSLAALNGDLTGHNLHSN